MTKVIKATDLHTRTRDVIEWARVDGQTVVVEYFGRPAVVIMGYKAYQDYLAYQKQRQAADADGAAAGLPATVEDDTATSAEELSP
jgi:glycine/serine hydroxymethyltransferase